MSSITGQNLHLFFPKQVPMDIVNIITKLFLWQEISAEAGKLYENTIPKIINRNLVPKEPFVEKVVDSFCSVTGSSFKNFLSEHADNIKEMGKIAIYEGSLFEPVLEIYFPHDERVRFKSTYMSNYINYYIKDFMFLCWEKMGENEGLFTKTIPDARDGSLETYLDTLISR